MQSLRGWCLLNTHLTLLGMIEINLPQERVQFIVVIQGIEVDISESHTTDRMVMAGVVVNDQFSLARGATDDPKTGIIISIDIEHVADINFIALGLAVVGDRVKSLSRLEGIRTMATGHGVVA